MDSGYLELVCGLLDLVCRHLEMVCGRLDLVCGRIEMVCGHLERKLKGELRDKVSLFMMQCSLQPPD